MSINQLFVDMDGVFVNFLGGCLRYFRSDKTLEDDWPKGVWGDDKTFMHMFGVDVKTLFKTINFNSFWSELDYTHDGKDFLKFVNPYEPVILTAPSFATATGKQIWIKQNLPQYYHSHRYLIGPAKKYVARPGAILIDDCDRNIDQWRDAGGTGILYPRPWNSLHYIADSLRYTKDILAAVMACSL